MGAVDPSSGTAILLELARLLGKHIQKGWRPKRTIMLASWDGEEYGMLGSTVSSCLHDCCLILFFCRSLWSSLLRH